MLSITCDIRLFFILALQPIKNKTRSQLTDRKLGNEKEILIFLK